MYRTRLCSHDSVRKRIQECQGVQAPGVRVCNVHNEARAPRQPEKSAYPSVTIGSANIALLKPCTFWREKPGSCTQIDSVGWMPPHEKHMEKATSMAVTEPATLPKRSWNFETAATSCSSSSSCAPTEMRHKKRSAATHKRPEGLVHDILAPSPVADSPPPRLFIRQGCKCGRKLISAKARFPNQLLKVI